MATKKKKTVERELRVVEKWRGRWPLPENIPEEYMETLNERYNIAERWEAERRKQGQPFNEQFCADVYAIIDMMTRDNSFKGKFDPEVLYREMCETMDEMRRGKKDYSLYDEAKVLGKVMDKHRRLEKKNKTRN